MTPDVKLFDGLKAAVGVLGRFVYHFMHFQRQGLTTGGSDRYDLFGWEMKNFLTEWPSDQ